MLPALLFVVSATEATPLLLPPSVAPIAHDENPDDPWKRLKVSADGRLRAESTFDQLNDEDRHRGRMRFRLSAEYRITDELKAGARLTTMSDGNDANNPHWDFGDGADGFRGAEFGLDRFFLEWKPTDTNATFTGGKFGHVFTRPSPAREFAWDDDVQPAGVAAVWGPKTDGDVSFDVRGIYAVASEVNAANGSGDDPTVFGAQANAYFKASDTTTITLATSWSNWSSLENFAAIDQGNTADNGGFAIWDTYLAATCAGEGWSQVTGFGQYFNNTDDESGDDQGFALGLQVGQTKGQGNWNAFAAYYDLDANAVFSPVAQDDTPIAGTGTGEGMSGILAGVQYFVLENVSLRLWALTSDADEDDDPYRLRFDIDFRIP